jgi:putative methionine-R-sulfoxide reductase with GAF domain
MNFFKNLSIISVILYLLGVLVTLIYLFNLPSQFETALPSVGTKWNSVDWIFYNTYIIVGIELALGIIAVVCLFFHNQKKEKTNIVYVDKYASNKEKDTTDTNLADSTETNKEIASTLSEVREALANQNDLKKELDKALSILCNEVEACQGAVFLKNETEDGKRTVRLSSSYAYHLADSAILEYEFGEGLTGQAAKEGKYVKIDAVPEGYINVFSGLGKSSPSHLIFVPLEKDGQVLGVMEIASFKSFSQGEEELLKQASPILSKYLDKNEAVDAIN